METFEQFITEKNKYPIDVIKKLAELLTIEIGELLIKFKNDSEIIDRAIKNISYLEDPNPEPFLIRYKIVYIPHTQNIIKDLVHVSVYSNTAFSTPVNPAYYITINYTSVLSSVFVSYKHRLRNFLEQFGLNYSVEGIIDFDDFTRLYNYFHDKLPFDVESEWF